MSSKPILALGSALAFGVLTFSCKGNEGATASGSTAPAAPVSATAPHAAAAPRESGARSIHSLEVKRLDGTAAALSAWAGKVLLVVNTASECGYTPQYEGLQALHVKFEARGFAVLGFPSNDFGGQEPGSPKEIATFCKTRFGVTFPMFDKLQTTGPARAPLYALLSDAKGEPRWNFHKYLVDKKGTPVRAWASSVTPASSEIAQAIEAELAAP